MGNNLTIFEFLKCFTAKCQRCAVRAVISARIGFFTVVTFLFYFWLPAFEREKYLPS